MMPKLWWARFACTLTQDCGQDRPHLGWLAHPPGERAQRLSAAEAQPNGRHLEQLPGYAPDLNPDEGIWNYLKRVELGNVCCSDFDQLYREIIRAKERLRHKKGIIISCARQCGYLV